MKHFRKVLALQDILHLRTDLKMQLDFQEKPYLLLYMAHSDEYRAEKKSVKGYCIVLKLR